MKGYDSEDVVRSFNDSQEENTENMTHEILEINS